MFGSSSEKSPNGLYLRVDLGLCAIIVLAAIFLTPILKTPLLGDDAFNSYLTGYMKYHGMSWLALMHEYDGRLILQQGRYIPGTTVLQFTMWGLTQSAVTIKIVQVCAIIANLALFFFFLLRLSRSRSYALWATTLVLATFEIREFYDPYAGIVVGMQLIMGTLLGAFILVLDEVDLGPSKWRFPLAGLLYTVAALTYEIAYLYVVVVFALVWLRSGTFRTAIRKTLPFVLILILLTVKDVWLRHNSNLVPISSGVPIQAREYVIAFNPLVTLKTWFWQTAGAVPLMYIWLDPKHYFPPLETILLRPSPVAKILAVVALAVGLILLRTKQGAAVRMGPHLAGHLAAVGFLLAIVPGFLLALSPRWQFEVIPGLAYLPVYHAGFGIAMLLAIPIVWLIERAGRIRVIVGLALPLALSFVLLLTYQANAITLALFDPVWNWGRENLTQSTKVGLFEAAPANSAVFLDTSYPFFYANSFIWDTRYLLYLYSDKRLSVYPATDINATSPLCAGQKTPCIPTAPAFQLYNQPLSYRAGADTLVKIDRIDYMGKTGVAIGHEATIIERGDTTGTRPLSAATALADRDFTIEATGPGWRRFHVTSSCGPINAAVFSKADLVSANFGTGFYGLEQIPSQRWHWAQRLAHLAVVNSLGKKQRFTLHFIAEALDPRMAKLTVRYGKNVIERRFAGGPLDITISGTLAPLQSLPVDFSTDAPKPAAINDPRDLHFRIVNETLMNGAAAGSC